MNGENFLLLHTPFFKQRYSISVNFYVGCRISCEFCYYKMSKLTETLFRPNSRLRKVGDAETLLRILKEATLISPAPITACASSDASMPENRKELEKLFKKLPSEYKVFMLHRPPWTKQEIDLFKDYPNAIFSTTITPLAYEKEWNRIKDNSQIQGLKRIRESGVPPERISVELGPITRENFEASIEIARRLYEEGIVKYVTIRGVSLGSYDEIGDLTNEKLIRENFIERDEYEKQKKTYRYYDGKEEKPHEFYIVKNYIPKELLNEFYEKVPKGLSVHRITPTLYKEEFGYPISLSRNNKPRKELVERYGKVKPTPEEIKRVLNLLEKLTGMKGSAVLTEEFLFIKGVRATEDVAHRVGREILYPIVFEDYTNLPTMEDLKLPAYREILEIAGLDRYVQEDLEEERQLLR